MHPLLAPFTSAGAEELRIDKIGKSNKPHGEPYKRSRQGSTINRQLRVVCRTCNQEWMSETEKRAAPVLRALIQGDHTVVHRDEVEDLAVWIALKIIVAEHSFDDNSTTVAADRAALMTARKVPETFRIYIGDQRSPSWALAYFRQAVNLAHPDALPNDLTGKNTFITCFGVGRLFVCAFVSRTIELNLRIDGSRLVELFPNTPDTLSWPPLRILSEQDIVRLANSIDRIIKDPNVTWFEHLPDRGG